MAVRCFIRTFVLITTVAVAGCDRRDNDKHAQQPTRAAKLELPGREDIAGLKLNSTLVSIGSRFGEHRLVAGDTPDFRIDAKEGGDYYLIFRNPSNFLDSRPAQLLLIGAIYVKDRKSSPEVVLPKEHAGELVSWKDCERMFPLILPGADPRREQQPTSRPTTYLPNSVDARAFFARCAQAFSQTDRDDRERRILDQKPVRWIRLQVMQESGEWLEDIWLVGQSDSETYLVALCFSPHSDQQRLLESKVEPGRASKLFRSFESLRVVQPAISDTDYLRVKDASAYFLVGGDEHGSREFIFHESIIADSPDLDACRKRDDIDEISRQLRGLSSTLHVLASGACDGKYPP